MISIALIGSHLYMNTIVLPLATTPISPALHAAIDSVVDEQREKLAIQKRIIADMREIWSLQPRFDRRSGNAPHRLLAHLRFRAGYDFMILRCDAGEAPAELGAWWTRFADADTREREELLSLAPKGEGPKKRRRRKPVARKSGAGAAVGSGD